MAEFDFDYWVNLARHDPPAYFRAREQAIMAFIDAHPAPQAERLREIQAHIDCVRAVCVTPGHATRQLTVMLEEHLMALQKAMKRLLALSEDLSRSLEKPNAP